MDVNVFFNRIYFTLIKIAWTIFYLPLLMYYVSAYYVCHLLIYVKVKFNEGRTDSLFDVPWILDKYRNRLYAEIMDLFMTRLNWYYVMDEEETQQTKEKIMKAIDPKKSHDYVCKSERKLPKEEQTVFSVKYLTVAQSAEIRDDLYQVSGAGKNRKEKLQTGQMDKKTLMFGLVGWRNFKNEDGTELTFDEKKKEEMLDSIPPDARSEIAGHIRGDSELNEGEE